MTVRAQPVLLLISAPSGAGKTTVCRELLAADPNLTRIVTCTTRPPRPGEQDGVDYQFLRPEEFERRLADGAFLEHARVYGERYGTLRRDAMAKLAEARDVLINVDVQGAAHIRELAGHDSLLRAALVTVLLTAPETVLAERLSRRGQDTSDVVQRRLQQARLEMAEWRRFDYLVTSGSVAEDLWRVRAILEAERLRTSRAANPSPEVPGALGS